jgi:urate oxidase
MLFESTEDLDKVYASLEKMVDHIQAMASEGKKFIPGKDPSVSTGEYKLYINEFYVGDNTLLVKTDDVMHCFIVHSGTNFIKTNDTAFCEYHDHFINRIIRRSSLISITGEKERNLFFQQIRERINAYRNNLVLTLANK